MNDLLENKRKSGVILGVLLIFIPYLTMGFMTGSAGVITFGFMDILFPPENTIAQGFYPFKGVIYPILALSVISVILNLVEKPFVILSAIVGILVLGFHILFYFWVAEAFSVATLGIAWYIMGIGFVLLVVSPFQKKSS